MREPRRQAAARNENSATTPSELSRPTLSRRSNSSLPPELQDAVPFCARECLEGYVSSSWHCPDDGAACLCSRYSDQGYTLGELAYICLSTNCGVPTPAENQNAYNICATSPRRVSPTHKTLTLLPTLTASEVSSTKKPNGTSTTRGHTTTTPSQDSTTSTSTPTLHTPPTAAAATMASSTSTSTAGPPPAAAESQPPSSQTHSTNLTHAQAAGVSIAAMGAIMLAIGIMYLIIWLRRRKVEVKDERKSYDFVDEAPPRFSPFNYGHADPRGPLGGFEKRRAELGSEKHLTRWPGYRMSYDDYVNRHLEKSVSITPPEKRGSDESERDLPHQLPTNPTMTKPLPVQLRGLPKSPAPTAYTTETMFEEDRPPVPTVPTVPPRKPLPKPPLGVAIHYPPPPPPTHTKPAQTYNAGGIRSPQRTAQPALSLAIPTQATRLPELSPMLNFPLPPAPLNIGPNNNNNRAVAPVSALSENPRNSAGSVLDYYGSREAAGYETSPDIDLPTPVQVAARKRRGPVGPSQTIKSAMSRPNFQGPKPSRMNSIGSDTSFESVDEDEPTPPEEEDKQLTPVQEAQPSPLAGIRYPKVPRSSNQAVPRSPKPAASPRAQATLFPPATKGTLQRPKPPPKDTDVLPRHARPSKPNTEPRPPPPVTPVRNNTSASATSTLSGTTLAAKRRGDNAAQDLERRFFVAKSAHERTDSHLTSKSSERSEPDRPYARAETQNSPLKGYGRVANSPGSGTGSQGRMGRKGGNVVQGGAGARYYGLPANPRDAGKERNVKEHGQQWEPKLTPSRRGEDLYLSVGVATPRTDYILR